MSTTWQTRPMSDARRYLLIAAIFAALVIVGAPFWDAHPLTVAVVVIVGTALAYEVVFWGWARRDAERDERTER